VLATDPGELPRLFELTIDGSAPPRPVSPEGLSGIPRSLTPDGKYVGARSFGTDPPSVAPYAIDGGDGQEIPKNERAPRPPAGARTAAPRPRRVCRGPAGALTPWPRNTRPSSTSTSPAGLR
jgi:hypothetical protein